MKTLIISLVMIMSWPSLVTAQDLSSRYNESIKSVVTIFSTQYKYQSGAISPSNSLGSGVIINKDGLIMTAAHVIETANIIKVKLHNGNSYDAEIIRSIPSADVALIKITEQVPGLQPATINPGSTDVKTGNEVYIIGAPLGIEHSLSSGHISGFLKRNTMSNGHMAQFIQTDAAINHGNSGGPMFNMNGHVIGIVSFILSESGGFEGIGYGVDIRTAKQLLLDDDSHFWSGFDGYFLDQNMSGVLNVPQKAGLLVQRVSKNSFAEKMGLKGGFFQAELLDQKLWLGGDIILAILGSSCSTPHSLSSIKQRIKDLKEGEEIYLKILRQGEVIELRKII
ncbi:trypsin-like peptidase domain-containing protein [Saprospiraceae bacterium]|nr:trypsin-like peptidase domain-containing protein [Saprospiraceae bacterium]